ncbi:MAG: hypothetical protein MAG581_02124 [Deltaproteobacteria bacterium]|jgi:putative FmdB family regulatory protein|nr:hypothetical protein [Deltaproteobacteria bacterium]
MPIYEYLCISCGYEFEEVQKFSDPSLEDCPDCGKNSAKRQVSMSAFHLKGGGWYKDGYSGKSTESEKTESGKEKKGATNKKESSKDKPPSSEKSGKQVDKESTTAKKSETSSKEKAA